MSEPHWITRARSFIGMREIPGPKHEPRILKFWELIKAPFRDDETSWCGAFVGGVLSASGLPIVGGAAAARSWLKLPAKLAGPVAGCVVVFWRGSPQGWSGHVGFVVGRDAAGNLMVLGGNQGDAVNIKPFAKARVLGYRWPDQNTKPPTVPLPLLTSDGRVSTNEA
ncbi:TIGR02594 family protein [Rhizobium azibense]|uniref:Uncharacterized protein (TIGR02594 family) n=1 Tax=Rhizobium azibense TaxID=1136135 RepID=A0A4R3RIA2_9HYPH|nr:TIGR02594 family protein [Rhizobium azibense]TCU34177.1 uncharacterized protein (TIGR02594 family) [Rhizobium azibense]